jgi:hypothetical protein
MAMCRSLLLLAVAVLVGCVHPPPPLPPGPSGLQRIVVEEPVNRTGGDLVVEGPGVFERLIGENPSSVPDVLAEDLRAQLEYRGFRLDKSKEDVPVFRTEIRRWDPYTADYATVTVDIAVALIEPGSGRTLWSATRSGWKVRTIDARSRSEAFRLASAAIAEAVFEGWQPVAP